MDKAPVGIFDSDIGGLSVVAEFRKKLPCEDIYYFADTKNYPYGTKTSAQVSSYFEEICDFLIQKGVKALFCACSTASAVALPFYKNYHNKIIQGLFNEELVTETSSQVKNGEIGLIATELTVKSKAFENLFSKIPNTLTLKSVPATDLVNAVTRGDFSKEILTPIFERLFEKFNLNNLGGIIIGCTHFYHIKKELRNFLGDVAVIEPAKVGVSCITKQLKNKNLLKPACGKNGKVTCFVSGNQNEFRERVAKMEAACGKQFIDDYSSI